MSTLNREAFARKLCSLYDHFYDDDFDATAFNAEVMQSFLDFASDIIPFHRRCIELIEYGSDVDNTDPDKLVYGFKVKGREYIFLSSIMNELEVVQIPREIKERFPDMTQEQWKAAMRVAGMILLAFSPSKPISLSVLDDSNM